MTHVDIRPGINVLALFRHLNYRPWYAMAELVDNALQSFLTHRAELQGLHGEDVRLTVTIDLQQHDDRIVIRDNAAGIHEVDYQRAFRTAQPPPDRSGLSQFGVGLKSAACWFARTWSVRTSALGEPIERLIRFDIDSIVNGQIETLEAGVMPAPETDHYTEIILEGLHDFPQKRTVGKMKEHLGSIFRLFLDDGELQIIFNTDEIAYHEPDVLRAADYRKPDGEIVDWAKQINVQLDGGRRLHGFVTIMRTGNTSKAGLALFRNRRLIQGSADEAWRPERIFGRSNSYRSQRVYGELEVVGFEVSHTKDGFRWSSDEEEELLAELARQLDAEPLPLLRQAEEYRARAVQVSVTDVSAKALDSAATAVRREASVTLSEQVDEAREESLRAVPTLPPKQLTSVPMAQTNRRMIDLDLYDQRWHVVLETTTAPSVGDWLELSDDVAGVDSGAGTRTVGARLSLAHPFMRQWVGANGEGLEALLRVAVALALAESAGRAGGIRQVGQVRKNVNALLRGSLARP